MYEKRSWVSMCLIILIIVCINIANETTMPYGRENFCRVRCVSAPTLWETFRCSLLLVISIIGIGIILVGKW